MGGRRWWACIRIDRWFGEGGLRGRYDITITFQVGVRRVAAITKMEQEKTRTKEQ